MIVSINQPAYLPWLGYFDRIDASDIHVELDHVQFEKNSFVNRNQIRTPNGTTWLTIPVKTSGQFGKLAINAMSTATNKWRKNHPKSLQSSYARCAAFKEIWDDLERFYADSPPADSERDFLPFINSLNAYFIKKLDINDKNNLVSSSMEPQATKSGLVLEICQKLNATTYLSGPFGRDYLDLPAFEKAGIEVAFHDYQPVEYEQAWPEFFSHLGIVDALLTHGSAKTRAIMLAGRKINNFKGEPCG